jgi:hypothetical protein
MGLADATPTQSMRSPLRPLNNLRDRWKLPILAIGPGRNSRVPRPLRRQRVGTLLQETCAAPGSLSGRAARRTCGNSDGEMPGRRHVSETLPLLMPSCTICRFSSEVRSSRGLLPIVPLVLEALTLARCGVPFSVEDYIRLLLPTCLVIRLIRS